MTFIAIMYVWYKMAIIAVELKLLKWLDGLEWIGSIDLNCWKFLNWLNRVNMLDGLDWLDWFKWLKICLYAFVG